MEALDLVRFGVSKLRIDGWLLVTKELLEWLVVEFPLLRSIKIRLKDSLGNRITRKDIASVVDGVPHLYKLQVMDPDIVLGHICQHRK